MSLQDKVMAEMKEAMRSKNEAALRGLRAIKAAITIALTSEGAAETLSEETEVKLLQKLVKQRKDSLEIFQKQNRPDLATKEIEELSVIEKFLPAQMSEADVREEIKKVIAQMGATNAQDMGKVMGSAMKTLGGKADGKMISAIVKELLG